MKLVLFFIFIASWAAAAQPAPDFCREKLAQAATIFSGDVYENFGSEITADISSDAAKRLYEKSADFKAKKAELKKIAGELAVCKYEFTLAASELSGSGESGTEGNSRIRGFFLYAGQVNEYDIISGKTQNARGIVAMSFGENSSVSFSRVDHMNPGFLIRLTGLKTTMIGDMPQFPVGFGNAGKHYFELGGLSDQQIVDLEQALKNGGGGYTLRLTFQLAPALYLWIYGVNPMEGNTGHRVVDSKKVVLELTDPTGQVVKSWR